MLAPISLPASYASLPYTQIQLSHVPASSPTPTPIILLTLYRPSKYNAFTDTMMTELESAFTLFDVDDRVRCIVVTGHGKMFCAGADLETSFKGDEEKPSEHRDGGGRVSLAIHRCRKPTIAAINGSAVGVGITMTLPMSIRVAYSEAKIGFVFARRGIIMEACSSFFLPKLIGETLSSAAEVLPRALSIADEVVRNTSTVSTYLMRDLMWRGPASAEATHLLDSRLIYEMFSKADNKEGVKAFLEKRPVNFSGTMDSDAPSSWPWYDKVDVVFNSTKASTVESKPKL
ncbi:hypothetical protein MBLNU459_g5684t1 [Dothideomycetes sp. NU459]